MSVTQNVSGILRAAEQRILQAVQYRDDVWTPVVDDDGNPDLPCDERNLMVFLCGDRSRHDARPSDAEYGLRMGYFDQDRRCWYVAGRPEKDVTHWMETPPDPAFD